MAWASSLPKVDTSAYAQVAKTAKAISKVMAPMAKSNEWVRDSARQVADAWSQYPDWAREVSGSMLGFFAFAREIAASWAKLAPQLDLSGTFAEVEALMAQ